MAEKTSMTDGSKLFKVCEGGSIVPLALVAESYHYWFTEHGHFGKQDKSVTRDERDALLRGIAIYDRQIEALNNARAGRSNLLDCLARLDNASEPEQRRKKEEV